MAEQDHSNRAPYAPMRGILVPIVSLALSVPTIIVGSLCVVFVVFDALTGHSLYSGAPRAIQVPLPVCLSLVLGPILAAVLCTTQRTRAEQLYGSALLLGYRMKRLNTIALWCAALAMLMIPIIGVASIIEISLHPQ